MKKYFSFIGVLAIIYGCSHSKSKASLADNGKKLTNSVIKPSNFEPYKLIDDFTVVDTGAFDNGLNEGTYAIIKKNNVVIDTIEIPYGIKEIDKDEFMYFTIVNSDDTTNYQPKSKKKMHNMDLGKYIILKNNKKVIISSLALDFDDYFSSPEVINKNIFYWAIKKLDKKGNIALSAAVFDPITLKSKTKYLINDILETDDGGYLRNPYLKSDTVVFDFNDFHSYKFSKYLKLFSE